MFIHRKPHTSVSAFPSGQIATKQNKTQNEQQHTQKKKVLAKGEATVTKKKKKIRIPDVKTWGKSDPSSLS